MTSPLLATQSLTVRIGGNDICTELDLQINPGESWCILGRNGAGKTTLLHSLAGLRPMQGGQVEINGAAIDTLSRRHIAQQLGLLLQDHDDAFPATVLETALTGRHPWLNAWQWESAQDIEKAQATLSAVGLAGFEQRNTTTLSGGERRRLGIATLLTQNPQLLLLDEPTNHLDMHHQVRILNLLKKILQESDKAMIAVLHDINLATRFCTHFLLLFGDGESLQGSADDILTHGNLEALYDHPLETIQGPHGRIWLPK